MKATISACSVQFFRRTTLFMPTLTSRPVSRSNTAAPNGPPLPRTTFSRDSAIARRILSSSPL